MKDMCTKWVDTMATRDSRSYTDAVKPRGRREKVINLRVSEEEHARLKSLADTRFNGSVSAMLRTCATDGYADAPRFVEVHDVEAAELAKQIHMARLELAQQGRNLNQATRALNRAQTTGTLDTKAAAKSLAIVKGCETWLESMAGVLSNLEPIEHAVMTTWKAGDLDGYDQH